jgi:hypothetical protein
MEKPKFFSVSAFKARYGLTTMRVLRNEGKKNEKGVHPVSVLANEGLDTQAWFKCQANIDLSKPLAFLVKEDAVPCLVNVVNKSTVKELGTL